MRSVSYLNSISMFLCFLTPLLFRWGQCTCFTGYEGNDCSRRSCPTGPQFSDIPYAADEAHQYAECSGKGVCDYQTGACKCNTGYSGRNCGHLGCINDCSDHGICMSLREAAKFNDGYLFNRTTTYTRWFVLLML